MKKILLLKSPYNFFPVGMAHVMSALRENDIPYDFVDLLFDNAQWKKGLEDNEYLAVATGGLAGDFNCIRDFAIEVKALSPETPLILGGNLTFDVAPSVLFGRMPIDYAVIGEAEVTFPELLRLLHRGDNKLACDIAGIVYRDESGGFVSTPPRQRINLKEMDYFPVWDQVDMSHYLKTGVGGFPGFRAMPVLTGRGCTGKCTFCSPTNGPFRMRDIARVIEELRRLNGRFDFDGFAFINEIFYPSRKMIEAFLTAYEKSGIAKPWVCLLRVDVEPEVLHMMKGAGCIGISFGVESGSNRILRSLRKRVATDHIRQFYSSVKKAGIPAFGSFMLGNEGETASELAETIDFLIDEDIRGPSGLVIAYPGTEIYRNALNRGRIRNEADYLEKLDFSPILNFGTFRNIGYMNISAMPDEIFFKAVMTQFRRYSTNLYQKMQARDVDVENLTGCCPVCGNLIEMPLKINTIIGMESACDRCFNTVYFNLYDHPLFRSYTEQLKSRVSESERVVVYGTGINGRLLQFYDVIGLDPSRVGFYIDGEGAWPGRYFFNHAVKNIAEIGAEQFDLIIVADTYSMSFTRNLLDKSGINPAKAIGLMPPEWLGFVKGLLEKNGSGVASLFEHGLNSAIPPSTSEVFKLMVKNISSEICAETQTNPVRMMVMPCGGFAEAFSRHLSSTSVEVIGFMDNFKSRAVSEEGGVPIIHPEDIKAFSYDRIFIATPSYKAQQEMKRQLLKILGTNRAGDVLLFGDLFLKSELKNESSYQVTL